MRVSGTAQPPGTLPSIQPGTILDASSSKIHQTCARVSLQGGSATNAIKRSAVGGRSGNASRSALQSIIGHLAWVHAREL
jgi:hypothetical protein